MTTTPNPQDMQVYSPATNNAALTIVCWLEEAAQALRHSILASETRSGVLFQEAQLRAAFCAQTLQNIDTIQWRAGEIPDQIDEMWYHYYFANANLDNQ